jgi:hypothetical protein
MSNARYTVLGWVVWQVARRVVKRKLGTKPVKIGAAAVVALALGVGAYAALSRGGE